MRFTYASVSLVLMQGTTFRDTARPVSG